MNSAPAARVRLSSGCRPGGCAWARQTVRFRTGDALRSSALRTWERWAALQGVHALAAPLCALRAYLRERASNGAGISALMTAQTDVAVGVVRKRCSQDRCVPAHPRVIVATATIIGNCELRAAEG